jgi:hypothetical protein
MTIELPQELEIALKVQANACGLSPATYVCEILARDLDTPRGSKPDVPFKTSLGLWAKYGISLSAEEIDENRADMFRNFGEEF